VDENSGDFSAELSDVSSDASSLNELKELSLNGNRNYLPICSSIYI
jgi:hypothetical protein